jgi:luciferase family oxidoreductase group 1
LPIGFNSIVIELKFPSIYKSLHRSFNPFPEARTVLQPPSSKILIQLTIPATYFHLPMLHNHKIGLARMSKKIDISVLDLGIVVEGENTSDALREIVVNARLIERLGYKRMWIAEHHNMPSVSTAATAVLIGHVAEKTTSLRVGAAGIMLPNHTPLAIAEQFGTLNLLYPNRIDLGLGRAPGTDQLTAAALRRSNLMTQHQFPEDVRALQQFFSVENASAKVRAFPGEGQNVPLWILGSSTDSAYLAAELGLPYAFASHFAPGQLFAAIDIYRNKFKPSKVHSKPHVMVGANIFVADSEEEAQFLKTSWDQMVFGMVTGARPEKLPLPVKELPDIYYRPDVQQAMHNFSACSFIGTRSTIKTKIDLFLERTSADELFITNYMHDRHARHKSFELFADAMNVA